MIGTKVLRLVALFAVISVVGISYVSLRYVGADSLIGLGPYTVKVQMRDSGSIFPDASVSYRGVEIGKVGSMRVTPTGIETELEIEQDSPKVPASSLVVIANRSAVGEQYADLQPSTTAGPYLEEGSVIPVEQVRTPLPVDQLLADVNALATSVPLPELRTTVDELYAAFDRAGPDLQRLLDASGVLIPDAIRNLPQMAQLLRDGRVVLNTQVDTGAQIIQFSRDLQLFTAQLKADDPNLRRLVTAAPPAAAELEGLIRDVGPDLSRVLRNLLVVTRIQAPRLAGLEQTLVTYPVISAGAPSVLPGDGRVHFGLVLNLADPPYCRNGYLQPDAGWRPATALDFPPVDVNARCNEDFPVNPRGAQHAPNPDGSRRSGLYPGGSGAGTAPQNDQGAESQSAAMPAVPAGGILAGSTGGAPPVIIPGMTP